MCGYSLFRRPSRLGGIASGLVTLTPRRVVFRKDRTGIIHVRCCSSARYLEDIFTGDPHPPCLIGTFGPNIENERETPRLFIFDH